MRKKAMRETKLERYVETETRAKNQKSVFVPRQRLLLKSVELLCTKDLIPIVSNK